MRTDRLAKTEVPLDVIEHGRAVLQALDLIGFATTAQLARLLFIHQSNRAGEDRSYIGGSRAAQRALRRLWLAGFVRRVPVVLQSSSTGFGYQHFVNTLTSKGTKALLDPKLPADHFRFRPVKISNQTVGHGLAINDLFVLGYRASQADGMGWHEWLSDRQLTAMNIRGSLKLVSIPDAFFVISHQGRYFGHFLEIDTGSETVIGRRSVRSWSQTIAEYGTYFRDHYPRDRYFNGFSAPIVLTITRSESRLEHLLQATKRGGGAGVYWYTTFDRIDPQINHPQSGEPVDFDPSTFWKPIWRVVNDSAPRSILDRLNRHPRTV